jgi:hypothetical protein
MVAETGILQSFNRGRISRYGLGRTDLKRTGLSAEIQTNWLPRVLGSMMLRPGMGYISSTLNHLRSQHIPFIYSTQDTAWIEATDDGLRVFVNEAPVTRTAVSSAVTNTTFLTDLSGWTDEDEAGATSDWLTGGYMSLIGTHYSAAIRTQQILVSGPDLNQEHAIRVVVARGKALLRIGTTSGSQEFVSETELGPGTHSLVFTPSTDFYIWVGARTQTATLVDSVAIEGAGVMVLPAPWAESNLRSMRWTQSADVVWVACDGFQQRKIERRGIKSWSVVLYQPSDGPFRTENVTTTRLTPSAISGDITVTSSAALFKSSHVGALFSITSIGQTVSAAVGGADQWTDPIRVTGVSDGRTFSYAITGTWTGTVRIQRSVGEPGAWSDVSGLSWTGNTSSTHADGLDNQIIYYRIGVKTGEYGTGTANVSLTYASGSLTGVVRITAYTSALSVSAAVLTTLGGTTASEIWAEGEWSDYRGWPGAVTLYEGRLWWAGRGREWGSISDAYESFDPNFEGDAGPISRNIGAGPVDRVNWLLPLQRLMSGTDGEEISARSSNFDEPLTPTNFNPKAISTQGSSQVAALKIDKRGVFVDKSGRRLYELSYDASQQDYESTDLTTLVPEIATSNIVDICVQRRPDTRIHCVLADGTVGVLVFDRAEDVLCWVTVVAGPYDAMTGAIEDAFVLPGNVEDKVYYLVKRTIDGNTVRYIERWSMESECRGGTLNKQSDSYVSGTNAPASITITGLEHLEGEEVVVWADGKDFSPLVNGVPTTYTVTSGEIELGEVVTDYVVGLYYNAAYKSMKLAQVTQAGASLNQKRIIDHLGMVLADTHKAGVQYGPDFAHLDDLPSVEDGAAVDDDYVWEAYDKDTAPFSGTYDTDSRVCMMAHAPRPANVLALSIDMNVHRK